MRIINAAENVDWTAVAKAIAKANGIPIQTAYSSYSDTKKRKR